MQNYLCAPIMAIYAVLWLCLEGFGDEPETCIAV